jgi:hypothetical protein
VGKLPRVDKFYSRWISYPVDKSYPTDKFPIHWIVIHRIKMRCKKHGQQGGYSYPKDNLDFNRRKSEFLEISYISTAAIQLLGICKILL